jgi:antirestriction protein ArdC/DNA polymerase III epsilon subunit-like protein
VSKKINLIKQFDDQLAVEMPEDISVSELIFNFTLEQNARVEEIRRVTEQQLEIVALRSLTASATENLTTDVRYFNVLRELSHFLSLATEGPRPNGEDRNTDLLPEYHPSSTAELSLDPITFRARRGAWYSADPRIEDEEVRSLVASVYGSHPMDVQFQHAYTRLLALPAGSLPVDIIVSPLTAGVWGKVKSTYSKAMNVFKGKNSSFWRSLRAKRQLRDSKGRWIEMGGGGQVNVRFPKGDVRAVPGKVAGYSSEGGYLDFEVTDVPGLKNALYKVPASAFEGVAAILPAEAVKNLPVGNAVPNNNDIIDIKDLVPSDMPEGWVKSPYTPTSSVFTGNELHSDAAYDSADGYTATVVKNPNKVTEGFVEKAKETYGDTLEIVGSDGTENLDMSKPLITVWASKRGKGAKSPIGFAQDWAGVQKIAGDEDDRFGDKDNQDLTPEEKPKAVLPSQPSQQREKPEDEGEQNPSAPYDDGSDPDATMPEGWNKIGDRTYLSKDRRFRVTYGYGPSEVALVYDQRTGDVSFQSIMSNGVYTLTERDGNGDFTVDTQVPFFNWPQIEEQVHAIKHLEALDPIFNPNIANVPDYQREMYSKLDPAERFQYDYFGPGSDMIKKADAIIAQFLQDTYPGDFGSPKFNDNGFWAGQGSRSDISARIVDSGDNLRSVQIVDKRMGPLKTHPIYPGEDENEVLTQALRDWFKLPDNLHRFSLYSEFKDFDITNGRSAEKTRKAVAEIYYEMHVASEDEPNKFNDDTYYVSRLHSALTKYVNSKEAKNTDLGPSQNRVNDDFIPNEGQVRRLVAILNSRYVQDEPELWDKVRAIRKNPEEHTVKEVNDLAAYIEKNFRELTSPEKGMASWLQKSFLNWSLEKKNWPKNEAEELRKKIDDNTLTREEYDNLHAKAIGLSFKPEPTPGPTPAEIEELEKLRAAENTVNGKPDYWLADQPTESPQYLRSNVPTEAMGPSDGQLVGIERFLEDRDIPEELVQEFMDNYKDMNAREIREWYYTFKEHPFKEQYKPKNKYGLVARDFDGASDRMLASIERIFDKGLASDREIAAIVKAVPRMNKFEVSTQIMSELKAREDAYDSVLIKKAIEGGASINDLNLMDLIGRPNAPEGWEDYKPTDEARKEILADEKDQEEVKQFVDRQARKNAARRSRYALSRLAAFISNHRDDLNADGKRIADGALDDVYDLKRMLDLRRKYVIKPAKVMERLETIRKGLTDSDTAHTYGRLKNKNSKTVAVLEKLAAEVGSVIGKDGYHNGPYEYDPSLEDEVDHSTSAEVFEPNPAESPEIPAVDDPVPGLIDYSNHPNRPRGPRRLKPKAFWGVVRDWVAKAKTFDDVENALKDKELHFIDLETTGIFDPLQPHVKNDPIQIAIYKVKNGEILDKFVAYMNPGSIPSSWAMANLRDDKGNRITPEWLASLPSKSEVMAKAIEFLGPNAVLAGHNIADFDLEVLNRTLREAGLNEYSPAGMVDTLGLADYIYNVFSKINPSGPYKMDTFGPFGSTAIEALARYEGIPFQELHDSAKDLEINIQLLDKMIQRAKSGTDLIKDNVFDLDASDKDYDAKLPKYNAGREAFIERAVKFIADMAVKEALKGSEPDPKDLEEEVRNALNGGAADGTPQGDGPPAVTLPVVDGEQPITESNVIPDPINRIKPPSPKQLKSVERRLLDTRGLVSAERAAEIWDLLPNVNSNEIGDLVREMDAAELDYAIANNLPIDNFRIPLDYDMEKLEAYKDKMYPDRHKKEGPSQLREGVNQQSNLSQLAYAMTNLQDALSATNNPAEKRSINSALKKLKQAAQDVIDAPSQNRERPEDTKNKAELATGRHDIGFLGKQYTDQQRDAIEAGIRGWSMVIKALAGTGKTTTLIAIAKAILHFYPKKRILALAFNKAIADENRTKFPGNTEIRTMDSVSFKASVNSKLSKKFTAMKKQSEPNNRPINGFMDLADYFKLPKEVELANGKRISRFLTMKIAMKGLNNWTISADDEMSRKHFEEFFTDKIGGPEAYTPFFLELAQKIWKEKLQPHDASVRQIPVNFNDMMKNFALSHPNFREVNSKGESVHGLGAIPDLVLIDEAQDVNGVFFRLMDEQETLHNNGIQLVVVGDPHQSIYQFRGAVNSLNMFRRMVTLPLTMMFRAGQDVADFANQILDIKDEDDERLVGNPNKTSSLATPGSMTDADMILTTSNADALAEIMTMVGRGQRAGVIREFKSEMNSFLATAKWLLFGANPKYRPSNAHEDLDAYDSWSQMLELQQEDPDPAVSRLLSIMEQTQTRLEEQNRDADGKAVFAELKRVVDGARIIGIQGFKKPEDGNWGDEGDIGNFISYKIKNGLIHLYNTGDAKPWAPELKNPNNGTKNNSDTLSSLGYTWDTGKTWDWTIPVQGDGAEQLSALVDALSGKDVDSVVLTAHRAKGLEAENVKLSGSWFKPNPQKDAEAIEKDRMPRAFTVEALNLMYVAATRTMSELDPGVLDWLDGKSEEFKATRKDFLRQLENRAKKNSGDAPPSQNTESSGPEIVEVDPNTLQKGDTVVTAKGNKRIKMISRHDSDEVSVFFEAIDGGGGMTYRNGGMAKKVIGGPSQNREGATNPDTKYDYTADWNTEYLGGPNGDSYKHTWSSPDGKYEADITNDSIAVRKNGRTIFQGDNSLDAKSDPENVRESSLDIVAKAIESDSDISPNRSTPEQPVMSQEEINAAYDEAIQAEYDYQMSLEPISRDPQFPGGERGLKELTEAVHAAERMAAEIETPVLDPIPNGLDPEEYVAQLRLALPNKKIELYTDENGNKFVKVSEVANRSAIFGASEAIFGWKDLEDNGPSQNRESNKPIKSNKDAVDQVMAQISEAMDKGIIPWKKPWTGGGAYLPTSGATGKNYKGGNLVILEVLSQFRGYKGTRWYTKNAIAKLGGYVDENDGVLITKVVKSKYTVKPDETKTIIDPKTGDQKPDDGSRTKTRLDIDVVYNEDVVKGITIPPLPRKDPPPMHEVEDIILASYTGGPNIQYAPGDSAFWSPQTDTISLPLREQFNSTEEHLDTLFHELVHSTGDPQRLDRKDLLDNYGKHKDVRAREELIAEIGSAILASMFGINTSIENVAAYVQSWKRFLETEPNALFEAASMASKAVDYILAGYYEDNPDEEYDPNSQPGATSMPIEPVTGEDGSSGGLGGGVNYRIEGNRIFLMGDTMAAKDLIKSISLVPKDKKIPFSFFWDRKANNWSISLADPEDRIKILEELKSKLGG